MPCPFRTGTHHLHPSRTRSGIAPTVKSSRPSGFSPNGLFAARHPPRQGPLFLDVGGADVVPKTVVSRICRSARPYGRIFSRPGNPPHPFFQMGIEGVLPEGEFNRPAFELLVVMACELDLVFFDLRIHFPDLRFEFADFHVHRRLLDYWFTMIIIHKNALCHLAFSVQFKENDGVKRIFH